MTDTAMIMAGVLYSFLTHPPETNTVANSIHVLKLSTLSQPLWSLTMLFIKLSIANTILRVQPDRFWRYFIYALITLQLVGAIWNIVIQVVQCNWDRPTPKDAKCISPNFR